MFSSGWTPYFLVHIYQMRGGMFIVHGEYNIMQFPVHLQDVLMCEVQLRTYIVFALECPVHLV